jgi:hypothetical protein
MKAASLRFAEVVCFLAALAFLVPPPVSDVNYPPFHTPALIIGGLLFAASLWLSWHRATEHWAIATIKLIGYLVLVWIAYEHPRI